MPYSNWLKYGYRLLPKAAGHIEIKLDPAEVATAWPAIQMSKMIGALHLHGTTSAKLRAQNASKFNLGTPT